MVGPSGGAPRGGCQPAQLHSSQAGADRAGAARSRVRPGSVVRVARLADAGGGLPAPARRRARTVGCRVALADRRTVRPYAPAFSAGPHDGRSAPAVFRVALAAPPGAAQALVAPGRVEAARIYSRRALAAALSRGPAAHSHRRQRRAPPGDSRRKAPAGGRAACQSRPETVLKPSLLGATSDRSTSGILLAIWPGFPKARSHGGAQTR